MTAICVDAMGGRHAGPKVVLEGESRPALAADSTTSAVLVAGADEDVVAPFCEKHEARDGRW
jgi:fatty acid/phospholipid biosynthesis enzyme